MKIASCLNVANEEINPFIVTATLNSASILSFSLVQTCSLVLHYVSMCTRKAREDASARWSMLGKTFPCMGFFHTRARSTMTLAAALKLVGMD